MSRPLFAVLTALALAPLIALVVYAVRDECSSADARGLLDVYLGSEPPGEIRLPRFELRDHMGAAVRSDSLRGRVVLTFLDSQCTETCPILASVIASAIDSLAPQERRQVEAVAISTDPREDTRTSVQRFLAATHALGRIRYLVAPDPDIRRLWREFKILSSLDSGKDTLHSARVRLYSRDGVWVATQHAGVDLSPGNLARDIRTTLRAQAS